MITILAVIFVCTLPFLFLALWRCKPKHWWTLSEGCIVLETRNIDITHIERSPERLVIYMRRV